MCILSIDFYAPTGGLSLDAGIKELPTCQRTEMVGTIFCGAPLRPNCYCNLTVPELSLEEKLIRIKRCILAKRIYACSGSFSRMLRPHSIFIDFSRDFLTKFCYSIMNGFRLNPQLVIWAILENTLALVKKGVYSWYRVTGA